MKTIVTSLTAFTAACALAAAPAAAQQGGEAKQVTIVVGFGAGGAYHGISLILSRHMGKHLPGKPTIVVQSKPGAGSLVAANYIAHVAPKDGSVLGTIGGGTILEPLFGNKKARFDPREINWLGSVSSGHNACTAWHATGIDSIEAAKGKEIAVGSTGRGSRTFTYPTALNNLLGTKFKVITGYRGMKDILQGIQTGELGGVCGYGWESIRARHKDWLRDRKLNIIAQFAYGKAKDLPDVPLVLDLVKPGRERQALKLLSIDAYIAWPLVAPPGLPEGQVAALRRAYEATMADPALAAEMAKIGIDVDPVKGEEVQAAVAEAFGTPEEVVRFTRRISGLQ